jgi:hypothetical protein
MSFGNHQRQSGEPGLNLHSPSVVNLVDCNSTAVRAYSVVSDFCTEAALPYSRVFPSSWHQRESAA